MVSYLVILFSLLFSFSAIGSACCGGASALPSVILGDFQRQFSVQYGNRAPLYEVDTKGKVSKRDRSTQEVIEQLRLTGSYQVSTYFQAGIQIAAQQNLKETQNIEEKSQGLSDVNLQATYEFLPETTYSPTKPRGFVFLQMDIPLSSSPYDAEKKLHTDSISSGFYRPSLGFLFSKVWGGTDALFFQKIGYGIKRKFRNQTIEEGWITDTGLQIGKSFFGGKIRLGTGATFSWKRGNKTTSPINVESDKTQLFRNNLTLSYLYNEELSLNFAYNDETLFPISRNTSLARGFSFTIVSFEFL